MEEVNIQVEVNPTEDFAKVKQAVENIFIGLDFEETQINERDFLVANGEG